MNVAVWWLMLRSVFKIFIFKLFVSKYKIDLLDFIVITVLMFSITLMYFSLESWNYKIDKLYIRLETPFNFVEIFYYSFWGVSDSSNLLTMFFFNVF